MEHRYAVIEAMYGKEGLQKISNSKILVIGSGGIGCEILKNLALSGFKNIDLIDLDTIDVSNLNRQFLFRPEHVGQSKAKIAAAATNKFNPDVNVTAKHGNIKDGNFDMNYFGKFTLVLNALDNIDARRHVNRLCLANKIPLIDAGTQGYLGQVMPILKGKTECYECTPKPIPKTYPICTIRSTPDKPVHCLVWAKECFKLLFGVTEESMLFEDPQSGDTSTYMHLVPLPTDLANSPLESVSISVVVTYGQKLLTALYDDEIQKRLDMGTYTTAKVVPKSLESVNIETAVKIAREILQNSASTVTRPSKMPNWDKQLWSAVDCCVEFLICVHELLFTASFAASRGRLEFDKDCDPIMRFVCATAVLRSHLFGIELVDYHRAKGIAGNIIPAIATT